MSADGTSETNQEPIAMKVLMDLISENEELKTGCTFSCDPEEALEYIEECRAEIAEIQDHPPSHILQKLEWKLNHLDHIGLDWRDGTRLQKFQDGAIAGGTLRTMVENKQLNWIEGISNLRKYFATSFEIGETPLGSILYQAEACWLHKKSHFYEQTVVTKLSDEEMVEQGVVCLKRRQYNMLPDVPSGGYDLFQVGRDWVQFYLQLQNVKNKLEEALIKCLRTGRVLAVRKIPFAPTLVHPSIWDDKPLINRKDDKLMFVFSGDFPGSWTGKQKVLKGQARIDVVQKVAIWLEGEYADQRSLNLRMTHREFVRLAVDKFRLSERACNDAWTMARIPEWEKRGRIEQKFRNK